MDNRTRKIHFLVEAGLIGALYAVLTYVSSMMGLAYGEVQFRISEALTILPVFTPAAIPGLVIGCIIANIGSPFGMVILCADLSPHSRPRDFHTRCVSVASRMCRGLRR